MQIVKDMGTPNIIAISDRDASNEQVTTWQTNAAEKGYSDVSSVVEIILQITRDAEFAKSYKRKHAHLSVWSNTLPHESNIP
jgi:hypothetical protein